MLSGHIEPRSDHSPRTPAVALPQRDTRTESRYLAHDQAHLLAPRADGDLPLRLDGEWLVEKSTGLRVNVDNRALRRLGIWGVKLRGTRYYPAVPHLGAVDLVREPNNPHDPNAVAVTQDGVMLGHYNRGMAPGLAKVIDSGSELSAILVSLSPLKVVAAAPDVLSKLTS